MAIDLDVSLRELERFAHGHEDLLLDEVDAGDLLGDRVLDLDALVDLEEVEVALVVDDELNGASVGVLGLLGDLDGGLAHLGAQLLVLLEQRRRRLLDELLVAALDRAVALAEVDDVALGIAQDLELDVARVLDEFLDVNPAVAERLLRLAAGGVVALDEGDIAVRGAHALAAAAGHGLDHDRVADLLGDLQCLLLGVDDVLGAGGDWHAGLAGQLAAQRLVLEGVHRGRFRPDKADVAALANIGEVGVLGEEPVAGMDGVDVLHLGGGDDAVDPQVAFAAGGSADADRVVGHLGVHRVCVRLRVDGDGADVQLPAGADDPDGDLPAIGYQYFLKHSVGPGWRSCCDASSRGAHPEQRLAELHRAAVLDENLRDHSAHLGLDLVHHLHRLDDANHGVGRDRVANLDVRLRLGRRLAVERADHRRLDLRLGRLLRCRRCGGSLGRCRHGGRDRRGRGQVMLHLHLLRFALAGGTAQLDLESLLLHLELREGVFLHQVDDAFYVLEFHGG